MARYTKLTHLLIVHFSLTLQVEDPAGNRQYSKSSISSDEYTFSAARDGKYVYCFGNEAWSSNSKEVSFNVHGVVYIPESEAPSDPLESEGSSSVEIPSVYSMVGQSLTTYQTVRRLSNEVTHVKDEQSYIIVRERTHRNTAESTNARVKWWSLFQLMVLIGEGVFQVWWLKRFFEVRNIRIITLGRLSWIY